MTCSSLCGKNGADGQQGELAKARIQQAKKELVSTTTPVPSTAHISQRLRLLALPFLCDPQEDKEMRECTFQPQLRTKSRAKSRPKNNYRRSTSTSRSHTRERYDLTHTHTQLSALL
jgi:hypothetical protein